MTSNIRTMPNREEILLGKLTQMKNRIEAFRRKYALELCFDESLRDELRTMRRLFAQEAQAAATELAANSSRLTAVH